MLIGVQEQLQDPFVMAMAWSAAMFLVAALAGFWMRKAKFRATRKSRSGAQAYMTRLQTRGA